MKLQGAALLLAALAPCWAQTLYATFQNETGLFFSHVDLVSGSVTAVAGPFAEEGAQELSAFNQASGVYFLVGVDDATGKANVLGYQVDTEVHFSFPVPFTEAPFVGLGEFVGADPTQLDQVILGGETADGHVVGTMDLKTGAFTQVGATFNKSYIPVLDGASGYDASTGTFLTFMGCPQPPRPPQEDATDDLPESCIDHTSEIFILAVDMATGAASTYPTGMMNASIDSMDYDSKLQRMVGMSVAPTGDPTAPFERTIVSFDPVKDYKYETLSVVQGYAESNGNIATLNANDQELYMVLLESGVPVNTTAQWYVVAADLQTGDVKSAMPICKGFTDCPWSMEYSDMW